MQSKGTVKTLALLIEFPDYPHVNSSEYIYSNLFGPGDSSHGYFDSLSNYYKRSSYQQLNISGSVLGWYKTNYNRDTIVQSDFEREKLIKEVMNYYHNEGHDFSQYDNDNDGYIDCLMVYWSGPDNGWANFWWGEKIYFNDPTYSIDGKKIGGYTWQWESNPVGSPFWADTAIHEVGHILGLPDYYDYNPDIGPKGGAGGLDIMDGVWGDHNGFSKWVLDWISPNVISSGTQSLTLNPSGISKDAVLMMPEITINDLFSEFFLVQNRSRTGNDIDYPGNGFVIWHVDAKLNDNNYLYNNSNTAHKLLRVMEADGLEEIESCGPYYRCANAGDYYVPGTSFGDFTAPSSKSYSGQTTGVTVSEIRGDVVTNGVPLTATFSVPTVLVTVTSSQLGISPLIVDGQGYAAPTTFNWVVGSTHTLEAPAVVTGDPRDRFVFMSWSDGGTRQHVITVPSSSTTYTAYFQSQYELRTSVNPSGSGSVSPNCTGGCWVDNGAAVDLSATPGIGFYFSNWADGVSGTVNPVSVTMASPVSVTANFTVNQPTPNLSVAPAGGLSSAGTQGGPFAPASVQYTLQNTGGVSLDWTASKSQSWVTLSPAGGKLSPGQSTSVTVSINSGANSFAAGSYVAIVAFTNTTNGYGNTTRGVALLVSPIDPYTLVDLTISGGPSAMNEGGNAAYTATAMWGDGTTSVVNATWNVTPKTYASIGATTGILEALSVPGDQTVMVQASFSSSGMTRTATKTVTIVDVQDADGDGVLNNEEMSPDGLDPFYDGNGDGIPDWKQDNVASLHSYDRRHYVTMETNFRFADVRAKATPASLPPGVAFPYGLFTFKVLNVPSGGSAMMRFYLDAEWPNVYYKYGPTPLVPAASWYNFSFDAIQGTGATTDGFTITLHFKDGEMGDDDLMANGAVLDDGGPGVSAAAPPPTSGGGGGGCGMAEDAGGTNLWNLGGAYGMLILVLAWLKVRGAPRERGRPDSVN